MRKTAAFLLVATAALFQLGTGCTSEAAQLSRSVHIQNEPGKLETFLLSKPNASIKEQPLGALPAPEDTIARFTGIVAEDPLSKNKAKGLKVELKNGEHADVVYLDEEGLKELQQRLIAQMGSQRFLQEHLDKFSPSDLEVNHAVNQSPATGEWYAPLVVGFYRNGDHFGVYLNAPWGTRHQDVQLRLADANTGQVVDLLAKARAFLQAN
ncbi:MAG: hypothetical protein WB763_02810 [Terriglobia bacterium]|jgi:hypothetical protein